MLRAVGVFLAVGCACSHFWAASYWWRQADQLAAALLSLVVGVVGATGVVCAVKVRSAALAAACGLILSAVTLVVALLYGV